MKQSYFVVIALLGALTIHQDLMGQGPSIPDQKQKDDCRNSGKFSKASCETLAPGFRDSPPRAGREWQQSGTRVRTSTGPERSGKCAITIHCQST